jgi:hypothetical protein
MLGGMTAKVTLSFSDDTIADARHYARRDGMSLSAWVDQAAREKALREMFGAHAAAVRRAGFDYEAAALADEQEIAMTDAELFGHRRREGRPEGSGGGSGIAGPGDAAQG